MHSSKGPSHCCWICWHRHWCSNAPVCCRGYRSIRYPSWFCFGKLDHLHRPRKESIFTTLPNHVSWMKMMCSVLWPPFHP